MKEVERILKSHTQVKLFHANVRALEKRKIFEILLQVFVKQYITSLLLLSVPLLL